MKNIHYRARTKRHWLDRVLIALTVVIIAAILFGGLHEVLVWSQRFGVWR